MSYLERPPTSLGGDDTRLRIRDDLEVVFVKPPGEIMAELMSKGVTLTLNARGGICATPSYLVTEKDRQAILDCEGPLRRALADTRPVR